MSDTISNRLMMVPDNRLVPGFTRNTSAFAAPNNPQLANAITGTVGNVQDWLAQQQAQAAAQGLWQGGQWWQGGGPTPQGAQQIALALMGGMGTPEIGAIKAYHGSPYDFPAFDISRIGTGEGAQVYGHGLYFAESPQVAKTYREALASNLVGPSGEMVRPPAYSQDDMARLLLQQAGGDWDKAITQANADAAKSRQIGDSDWLSKFGGIPDRLREMQQQGYTYNPTPGRTYEVNIQADPEHFLDWDKPLSEQSDYVKQALSPQRLGLTVKGPFGPKGYYGHVDENGKLIGTARTGSAPDSPFDPNETGQSIYRGTGSWSDPVAAAQRFRDAGIPGIRYLDQGSRAQGQGTSNYVVFSDKIIDILRKYGIAGLGIGLGGGAVAGAQQQPTP